MEFGEEDMKRVELIRVALHQLMEERKEEEGKHQEEQQGEEESRLLSGLLSKLESLEKDAGATHLPEESSGDEEPSSSVPDAGDCGGREVAMDEIVRDLRRVKRQNLITHCLLSVMIVVTAFWQLSEVSLLLAVKEKFRHPFRAVGDMITGSLKGRGKKPVIEAPPLPPIAVPEPPRMDLSSLTMHSLEE